MYTLFANRKPNFVKLRQRHHPVPGWQSMGGGLKCDFQPSDSLNCADFVNCFHPQTSLLRWYQYLWLWVPLKCQYCYPTAGNLSDSWASCSYYLSMWRLCMPVCKFVWCTKKSPEWVKYTSIWQEDFKADKAAFSLVLHWWPLTPLRGYVVQCEAFIHFISSCYYY